MAQTKYNLQLIDGVSLPIRLEKATEDTSFSFNRGSDGQPLRTILVKSKYPKVTETSQIIDIVPWSEMEQLYEDREGHYIVVDADGLKKSLFPKSDTMDIVSIVPNTEISPCDYTGYHYFLYPQGLKKQVDISEESCIVYSAIYDRLVSTKKLMVVQYVSLSSQKYAVVYPKGEHLMLSIIHYTDQHRQPRINIHRDVDEEYYDLLTPIFDEKSEDSIGEFNDPLRPHMQKLIDDTIGGKKSTQKEKTKPVSATGILSKLKAAKERRNQD